jgi:hypothetical protein
MIRYRVGRESFLFRCRPNQQRGSQLARRNLAIGVPSKQHLQAEAEDPIGASARLFRWWLQLKIAHSDGQSEADAGLNSASCATSTLPSENRDIRQKVFG